MAWIYLAESEELPLLFKNMLDRLFIVKLINIAKASSCKECKKGICPKHQFGMTYELYFLKNLKESTLYTGVSHAKIFPLQDAKKAWKESEAGFFSKYSESSMQRKLPSYSLKTSQTLGQKELNEFAKSWPKEGMIVDGVCYPLEMWERGTKGKDGSYWATPTTMDHLPPRSKKAMERHFATHRKGRTKPPTLREQMIPELWPTPAARDYKDKASPSERNRNTPTLATHAGGQLNPTWVEWLMGYQIGWTELKPLETA